MANWRPLRPCCDAFCALCAEHDSEIVSGHLATEAGYVCNQADAACAIAGKAGRVRLLGSKQKRLYRLDCKMMHASAVHEGYANVASEDVSTQTWHARLGHPGRQALMAVVAKANLAGVVPQELDRVCSVCMCAKHAREPFHRSAKNAEGVLDLLHTDIMGPFLVKSWGGSIYAVTLMDDHSRTLQGWWHLVGECNMMQNDA